MGFSVNGYCLPNDPVPKPVLWKAHFHTKMDGPVNFDSSSKCYLAKDSFQEALNHLHQVFLTNGFTNFEIKCAMFKSLYPKDLQSLMRRGKWPFYLFVVWFL